MQCQLAVSQSTVLHLNFVRRGGEEKRNIETVAILPCALGLRLLMLCPESSSKRPALTQEPWHPRGDVHDSVPTRARVGLAGRRPTALPHTPCRAVRLPLAPETRRLFTRALATSCGRMFLRHGSET